MTQEDKDLLLKDLCARLPYKVKAFENDFEPPFVIASYDAEYDFIDTDGWTHHIESFKPYLRPMSSMTEDEENEKDSLSDETEVFDWLLKNHFDFRGLIALGLAIEAPEGMYK